MNHKKNGRSRATKDADTAPPQKFVFIPPTYNGVIQAGIDSNGLPAQSMMASTDIQCPILMQSMHGGLLLPCTCTGVLFTGFPSLPNVLFKPCPHPWISHGRLKHGRDAFFAEWLNIAQSAHAALIIVKARTNLFKRKAQTRQFTRTRQAIQWPSCIAA